MKPFEHEFLEAKLNKSTDIINSEDFFPYFYLPYREDRASKAVLADGYTSVHLQNLGYEKIITEKGIKFENLTFYSDVLIYPENLQEKTNEQNERIEKQKKEFKTELSGVIEKAGNEDIAIVVTLPSTAQTKKEISQEDQYNYGGATAKFIEHAVCIFINSQQKIITVKDSLSGQKKDDGTYVEFSKELIESIKTAAGNDYEIIENKEEQQKRGELSCNLWSCVNLFALANDMALPSRDNIERLGSKNLETFKEVERLAFDQVVEIFKSKIGTALNLSEEDKNLLDTKVLKDILESTPIRAQASLEKKAKEISQMITEEKAKQDSGKGIEDILKSFIKKPTSSFVSADSSKIGSINTLGF